MNHQDVRNQYLQVHGIDPVEIEVDAAFETERGVIIDCDSMFDYEPRCNAAAHGRRCSTCTCEDSRDE